MSGGSGGMPCRGKFWNLESLAISSIFEVKSSRILKIIKYIEDIIKIALLFRKTQNKSDKKYSCYDNAYM
jgi:hypothetical protein